MTAPFEYLQNPKHGMGWEMFILFAHKIYFYILISYQPHEKE